MSPADLLLFTRAQLALNRGQTSKALALFDKAAMQSEVNELAPIEHMRGVCLRMLKQYLASETAFTTAFDLADDQLLQGKIKRDMAMIPLETDNPTKARELIDESLSLLQPHEEPYDEPVREMQRRIEHLVSQGFDARIAATLEDRLDYAYQTYMRVRKGLRGIAPYELNTLVWEMKIAPFSCRISELLWRGLWLSFLELHPKRFAQVLMLGLYRPLGLRLG